ncbi:transposable element Tcb1 transposase [Trichonephila clavipes]|nr:transposable element Tcb1 transposase [Trichonephila clavipes]
MPLGRFRTHYEQLSQFEKRRIIGMMEAGWSARQVARQLGRSDCACAAFDASVWSGAAHEETGLQQNGTRSSLATRESRFNLSSDDNRVHVWRSRGERLNHAFALQRHTSPTAGVMVGGAIATIHGHP